MRTKTAGILVACIILTNSLVSIVLANPPVRESLTNSKSVNSSQSGSDEPFRFSEGEKSISIRLAAGQFDPLNTSGLPLTSSTNLFLSSYPGDGIGYYLVQFNGSITEADKQMLIQAGVEIFDYIPDFTFVVKMNQPIQSTLSTNSRIRWIGLYQPTYRVEPALLQKAASSGLETVELSVVIFKKEDMSQIVAQLESIGGQVTETAGNDWNGKIRVQIEAAQVEAIANISGVKWVEQAPQWQLSNNKAADIMEAREVWNTQGLRGAGQTIAVADSGLDQGSVLPANLHDDFEDGNGNSRVLQIFDMAGDNDRADMDGHGTHVAGSVLGNGAQSGATPINHIYPASAYVGIAPEATLIFQALDAGGIFIGIPLDLNNLFAPADSAGADIHTNSWGSPFDQGTYTSEAQDVDEYIWDHKDFTILFAAGNEGTDSNNNGVVDQDSIISPGTAKNAITVGASENNRLSGGRNPGSICFTWGGCWPSDYSTNPLKDDRLSDNPDGLAAFSGRGPTDDGRVKPDLVAPGTNIASVRSSLASGNGWGAIDTNYTYLGGTSMSTPLVAGAAVLVREFYEDNEGITPSTALIKGTLINGASKMSPGQYGTGSTQEIPDPPRPNNAAGWGRVNVEGSLFPATPLVLSYDDEQTGLSTGEIATYAFTVTIPGHPIHVTLVWSDYPGTPAANGGLVNDLDLSVTNSSGVSLTSNPASQSVDRVNNVEGLDVNSMVAGVYTISVRGYNVPFGPQPYALIVSGAGLLGQPNIGSAPTTSTKIYLPMIIKPGTQQVPSLSNGTFENGSDGSWTEYSKKGYDLIVNSFYPNPLTPHSGSWGVWLGGTSDEVSEISQQVAIPTGTTSPYLTYWYWIASNDDCGYDNGWFEVNGTKLKTYGLCSGNNTNRWVKETVNLSGYAGQTVTIKFHVDTDNVVTSNFFLDDVAFAASSTNANTQLPLNITPKPGSKAANTQPKTQNLLKDK